MPNIRIKDIPTTASATSSTDFIGIDGSANGTRKLNAYSPTFGGNLTVSGTGGISSPVANGVLNLGDNASGPNLRLVGSAAGSNAYIQVGTSSSDATGSLNISRYQTGTSTIGYFNVYAGTSTFSGNLTVGGTKLQLIAGANPYIQNGTTLGYLQLNDDGTVKLASSASNKTITLANGPVAMDGNLTVSGGTISSGTATLTLKSTSNTVVLQSAGTTALTLDASQNATFAGTVTGSGGFVGTDNASNNAYLFLARSDVSFSIANETSLRIYSKAGRTNNAASGGVKLLEIANTSGDATFAGTIKTTYGSYASQAYTIGDASYGLLVESGNLRFKNANSGTFEFRTIAGTGTTLFISPTIVALNAGTVLKLGNAYVAGAPTATGYVTIQDSAGNTYKVLVGT